MSWEEFTQLSYQHCQEVYDKLNVRLTGNDVQGESAYRDDLSGIITSLEDKGILKESDGAKCVFPEGFKNKDDDRLGVIVTD